MGRVFIGNVLVVKLGYALPASPLNRPYETLCEAQLSSRLTIRHSNKPACAKQLDPSIVRVKVGKQLFTSVGQPFCLRFMSWASMSS